MALRNGTQPLCIIRRRHRRATSFDLNQDDLEVVAAFRSCDRLAVILPHGQHINYADRFPPALPQNVTSCHRVRAATRRMRTFVIVTAHRAVLAAFCCAFFQFTGTAQHYTMLASGKPLHYPAKPTRKRSMIDRIFKAYDVRATYPNPLNEETAWKVGHATAQFLKRNRQNISADQRIGREDTMVVGRDMRPSSPRLAGALDRWHPIGWTERDRCRDDRHVVHLLRD